MIGQAELPVEELSRYPDVPSSKRRRAELVAAAAAAGHFLDIKRHKGRVHVVCVCEWTAGAHGSFRQLISAATDHIVRAGLTAKGITPKGGEIPEYTGPNRELRNKLELPDNLFEEPVPRRGASKLSVARRTKSSEV